MTLTADEARATWVYEPETGILRWRVAGATRIKPGDVAGSPKKKGYLFVGYHYRTYAVHRVAWLIMTGEWPTMHIDHRDTDKGNNRWGNLRLATRAQNNSNVGLRADNVSGIKGVCLLATTRRAKRWAAHISHGGKQRLIGRFATKEEAGRAYATEALRLKGEFARL